MIKQALTVTLLVLCGYGISEASAQSELSTALQEYSDYLESIDLNTQITLEDSNIWIDRIAILATNSDDQTLNQSAWLAVMSLLNLNEQWDEALAVCEHAIDTAVDPQVRFDRLADRVAILAARGADGGRSVLGGDNPLVQAIDSFDTLPASHARTRAARYRALSWQAVRDSSIESGERLRIANRFLSRVDAGTITSPAVPVRNFRGAAAGLAMTKSLDDAVSITLATGSNVPSDDVVLRVAMSTALQHDVSAKVRTDYLFSLSTKMDTLDALPTSIAHIANLLSGAHEKPSDPLDPGSINELAGVPVHELIQLIAPGIGELITKHTNRGSVHTSTEQIRTERLLARSGTEILSVLYRLDGDLAMADHYRGYYKRTPFIDVEQLRLAP